MTKFTAVTVYVFLLSLTLSTSLQADSPFGVSVSDLVSRAETRNDQGLSARAAIRCAVLFAKVGGIIARDSPNTDTSEYDIGMENLFMAASLIDQSVAEKRGSKKTSAEISESLSRKMQLIDKKHLEWFEANFINHGEYFGSSPELSSDITVCRHFANMLVNKF